MLIFSKIVKTLVLCQIQMIAWFISFSEQLKDFKHMFDLILEGEKHVDQAKNNFGMYTNFVTSQFRTYF